MPDKAIDLIDEAGSRVRLRHAQLPEEARELDKELRALLKEKDAAVRGQDFEKAGQLRDREMELKAKITAITQGAKETGKAEEESGEGAGPMVDEQDIANIVAQWTGIPVEKVSSDESERLVKMEAVLHDRVIGQEEAVAAISRAIRRARVGLKNPNRPIASFIFSGMLWTWDMSVCCACLAVIHIQCHRSHRCGQVGAGQDARQLLLWE